MWLANKVTVIGSIFVEKRSFARTASNAQVDVYHEAIGKLSYMARDLSDGGVFLISGSAPKIPIGTTVQVIIKRYTGVLNQEPVAMTVVRHQGDGMGLAFS